VRQATYQSVRRMHKCCGESDSNMVIVHVNINGSKLLSTVRISAPNFAFTLGQIRHHSQRPGHTQNARPPRSYVGRFHYRAQMRDRREVRLVCLTHGRSRGTEKIKLYSSVIALSTIHPADRFPKKVMSHTNLGDLRTPRASQFRCST